MLNPLTYGDGMKTCWMKNRGVFGLAQNQEE